MDAAPSEKSRQMPRWWRRFVLASRRANLFLILEIAALISVMLMVWATWMTFTSAPPDGQLLPSRKVSVLLIGTLIPAMTLLVLAGRRLALRRAAGSTARLHVRLVFFFSMVAAVPTLLVAGFAAFLFQSGVDFWFSDNSRGLMQNANQLARAYYEQNQQEVGEETITMAGDLRYYMTGLKAITPVQLADKDFAAFMAYQMQGRDINESVILQRVNGNSMRVAAAYDLTEGNDPTRISAKALAELAKGSPVYIAADARRIEAVAPIDEQAGIYLYDARNSEATSFRSWEQAKKISSAYDVLTRRARALQLRFNLALFVMSLVLVGVAVWFALRFADRQVEPLTDLVGAAREVGGGNFALRVEGRTGADEIGMLNRAFNRMTAQLEKQNDALLGANRELDERRAFIEAVLESITSGIITLDREGRVLLMNSAAKRLLLTEGATPPVGQVLEEFAPQIAGLIAGKLSGGIVSYNKGGDLLTLAVKLAAAPEGIVITFDDITRQLLDQRQAAWSDVARRIAHEIKNPLTPIQLATERLKRRYRSQIEKDGELFDELTSTIVRQVGDLRKMVDEFSSFARLPKPVFRREDALDLVRQALFLQEVAHPQVDFRFANSAGESVIIACDRHQLGQAMTNVLKNAIEAVESRARNAEPDYRGKVAVSLSLDDEMFTIAVEDNGIGLPKDRERIVEPYVTTREKGTGLGLAIVNKIVEEHGGDMNFSSAGDGGSGEGGTRVTLRFARDPRVQAGEAAE
ncbi:MAG: HAMP domain-containing protein [Sphingomonadales bacterium]|nr:HAMP domain-containing protein [Sphingomonadales bacterium]MBD3772172.1 HAMP domain-containing protein [Paracoccaceae bacterium]